MGGERSPATPLTLSTHPLLQMPSWVGAHGREQTRHHLWSCSPFPMGLSSQITPIACFLGGSAHSLTQRTWGGDHIQILPRTRTPPAWSPCWGGKHFRSPQQCASHPRQRRGQASLPPPHQENSSYSRGTPNTARCRAQSLKVPGPQKRGGGGSRPLRLGGVKSGVNGGAGGHCRTVGEGPGTELGAVTGRAVCGQQCQPFRKLS